MRNLKSKVTFPVMQFRRTFPHTKSQYVKLNDTLRDNFKKLSRRDFFLSGDTRVLDLQSAMKPGA